MVGVAFQLSDDILDVTSDSDESGKTPGTDLREGVPTLPVLYALASTGPEDARLRELLAQALTDDAEHAEALALLRAHPAVDQARSTSWSWPGRRARGSTYSRQGRSATRWSPSPTSSPPAPPDLGGRQGAKFTGSPEILALPTGSNPREVSVSPGPR